MTKQVHILLVISLITIVIALIYYQGQKQGTNSEIVKQQEEQINIKNDIIKTKEFQQKIIKNNPNNNSNDRLEWLQLIWEKTNSAE